MTMGVHQPTVAAGLNPGGLWVRLCTDSGDLLAEHALSFEAPELQADEDAELANQALARGEVVRNFIYDGDSGACLKTVIVR